MFMLTALRALKLTLTTSLACALAFSGAWAQEAASVPRPPFTVPITR